MSFAQHKSRKLEKLRSPSITTYIGTPSLSNHTYMVEGAQIPGTFGIVCQEEAISSAAVNGNVTTGCGFEECLQTLFESL